MRWFEEHRLPGLVVAAVAGDQDVSHAAPAAGSFAGRFTQARFPAHLRLAGPQLVTERAASGLFSNIEADTKRSCPDQQLYVNDHRTDVQEPRRIPDGAEA
jgi:hypothetical protein